MKQSFKLRFIFIIVCLVIVSYFGLKNNMLQSYFQHKYSKYYLVINEVMINNRNSIKDEDGDYESWIEIYNKGNKSVNLKDFGLSNDPNQPFLWTFPNIIIEPKSFSIVRTSSKDKKDSNSPIHTNFKLNNKDKVILLTAPNDECNDIFALQPMGDNISYGRQPDGSSNLYGFDGGTPKKSNISEILIEGTSTRRLEEPIFSHKGGFYKQAFSLVLESKEPKSVIYYTLDGSTPTKDSHHYTNPLLISPKTNEATVIRARAYKYGYPSSEISTQSYFVEKNIYNTYNTPVISLVTDPKNLFDYEMGIYISGKIFDQWKIDNPNIETNEITPANYNQRGKNWERKGSIELFESNGTVSLVQNIGIRIYGGYSRANRLKSLSLLPRKNYDDTDYFSYNFFEDQTNNLINNYDINKFSRILLRTSSTDSDHALFRDAFIQSLIQNSVDLDTQDSQPCIVYINGKYSGIHNIREAYDKDYISSQYNINQEDVVIIKNPTGIAGVEINEGHVGDEMHYNQMINYMKENNLKLDSNYNVIKTQIDIDNFIEYNILQIYCDNRDWPGNNVRIWRKRTQRYNPNATYGHDGRWRWMVFDLDYGFGLFKGRDAVRNNSLQRATEKYGPEWPNPPWSTLLLRSLLNNNEFKNQFINISADRLNSIYSPETVLGKLQSIEKIYYPNIKNHIIRWNLHNNNIENWKDEIESMKYFAKERPKYVRQHIVEYFGLSGTTTINIAVDEGGIVKINSLYIKHSDTPWNGIYFKDIPITAKAIPKSGFQFIGWEGINKSENQTIKINLSENSSLKAIFKSVKKN